MIIKRVEVKTPHNIEEETLKAIAHESVGSVILFSHQGEDREGTVVSAVVENGVIYVDVRCD